MVSVSSEDQDGLLRFCLQLERCNGVVSADWIVCVGTLYICVYTFKQHFSLKFQSNIQPTLKVGTFIIAYGNEGFYC